MGTRLPRRETIGDEDETNDGQTDKRPDESVEAWRLLSPLPHTPATRRNLTSVFRWRGCGGADYSPKWDGHCDARCEAGGDGAGVLRAGRLVRRRVRDRRAHDGDLLPSVVPGPQAAAPRTSSSSASVKDALFAGYRPCLRCRPLEADGQPPEWVARLLAAVDAEPGRRLRAPELRALGISPERARRYFQRTYGMTFDAYWPRTPPGPQAQEPARGRRPRRGRARRGLRVGERLPRGLREALRPAARSRRATPSARSRPGCGRRSDR